MATAGHNPTNADDACPAVNRSPVDPILHACLAQVVAGVEPRYDELIAAHPDLQPALEEGLRAIRVYQQVLRQQDRDTAADVDQPATPPTDVPASSKPGSNLQIRCPECNTPIEVQHDSKWDDLRCDSCGHRFNLVGEDASAWNAVGTTMGHFELIEPVGMGGFGIVWKARDLELDRLVALKVPRQGQLVGAEAEQFLREARAAAQLRHPNIVSVHEVGREGETIYIVSDFIEGLSLAEWLTEQRMSAPEAALLCHTMAMALDHAHQAGVVHRDLKPANILLDMDGQPHLADFGLARRNAHESTITLTGQPLGTPAYMSPEQARGDAHTADHRSDIYSLGVVLFELLTRGLPFRGQPRMLLQQIVDDEPPNPRSLNRHVTNDLATICLKCLEKQPARRYASAAELADDLDRFLRQEPIHARPVSRVEHTWRWCRRRPAQAGFVLALVIAAVLASVLGVRETLVRHDAQARAADERWKRYLADMHTATQSWDDGNVQGVRDRINAHWPVPGAEDPRGFEWYYLWRQVRQGLEAPTLKHVRPVSVAFSPDGKLLAVGDAFGNVRVGMWSTGNHTLLRSLSGSSGDMSGHQGSMLSVSFSPDGHTVLSIGDDQSARIWDADTGRQMTVISDNQKTPGRGIFLSQGATLATSRDNGDIVIWETSTGKKVVTLVGHVGISIPLAELGNDVLLTIGTDQTLRKWEVHSGREMGKWQVPVDNLAVAVSRDASTLAIGNTDGIVRLFDVSSASEVGILPTKGRTTSSICWSPCGRRLAIGYSNGEVEFWDTVARQRLNLFRGHSRSILATAFSPDGSSLASTSEDGTVKLWPTAGAHDSTAIHAHIPHVVSVAIDRHSKTIASSGLDSTIKLWDAATGACVKTLPGHKGWTPITFSPTQDLLASGGEDETIRIWNTANGKLEREFTSGVIFSLAFSPDGKRLACCGEDVQLRIFDVFGNSEPTGTDFSGISVPGLDFVRAPLPKLVKFSPDGSFLAVGHENNSVFFVDSSAQHREETLSHYFGFSINALDFAPDGRSIVVGDGTFTVSIWDVKSGRLLNMMKGAQAMGVAFLPNGRAFVSAGDDGDLRIWDRKTGEERAVLRGHTQGANCVATSPDGRLIVSGGNDGTIRIWRAASPQDVFQIEEQEFVAAQLREEGKPADAAAALSSCLKSNVVPSDATWDLWFAVNVVDLGRRIPDLLNSWPVSDRSEMSRGAEIRWAMEQLVRDGVIRINCGGDEYQSTDHVVWGRDRFYNHGLPAISFKPVDGTEDDALFRSERCFPPVSDRPGYSIPLPPGSYRVTVYESETFLAKPVRQYDVLLEGTVAARNYFPPVAKADHVSAKIDVKDGFLDISIRRIADVPNIKAIEIICLKSRAVDVNEIAGKTSTGKRK